VEQILKGFAGLLRAIAMSSAFLQNDPNGWESLSSRLGHELTVPVKCSFWDYLGLESVFEASIKWLCEHKVQPSDCSLHWDELYFSLAVLDRSCPSAPVCDIALIWGISFESAEEVCCTFVKLSLAKLLARDVLSDYIWLLTVATRLSFSFAATKYSAVSNRVREQKEDHSGSNRRD
jgi:hypothetical protein